MKRLIKILLFILILEMGFILTLDSYRIRKCEEMWRNQQEANKSYNKRLNRLEYPDLLTRKKAYKGRKR